MPSQTAPTASLAEFRREPFVDGAHSFDVYRAGTGPAVIVLTEMPGISPQVLGFAAKLVAEGFRVALPDLFGEAGRDPFGPNKPAAVLYTLRTISRACVSKEFTAFAAGKSSPIVDSLRKLAAAEHAAAGGPGVGVVGMCFTGGFALAMAVDPHVLVPVLSQPSLPIPVVPSNRAAIDCSAQALDVVAGRCAREGLQVLGLRFDGDPMVPRERFAFLREKLGDGFVAIELPQSTGNATVGMPVHHSVLTASLVEAPGEPTYEARKQVIDMFRARLLPKA